MTLMTPLYIEYGQGYSASAPTESYCAVTSERGMKGQLPVLIYCHGSGHDAYTQMSSLYPGQKALITAMAKDYFVIGADLGLQGGWGNDLHRQRIEDLVAFVGTRWGFDTTKVSLMAGSMGCLGALQYARVNPGKVRNMALIIPAVDLADLLLRGAAADINAAYGGAYNDATDGPTHSPVQYAASLPSSIPIDLFTASDDTLTVPATATAFVNARPLTRRRNLGALGHSDNAVAAAIPYVKAALAYVKPVRNG